MINLKRVEFVITWACPGKCRHCSLGEAKNDGTHLEYAKLAGFLTQLKRIHPIESVMCFGGEPLLFHAEVFAILDEARRAGIPSRSIITCGLFCRDADIIQAVAMQCNECDADILLSVDAFHQETIPLEPVLAFSKLLDRVRLHPAWLVSEEHDNPYNNKTRKILAQFEGIPVTSGNVILQEGNALLHLAEYFTGPAPKNPYIESPDHVTCISVNPNGSILAAEQIVGSAYEENLCFTSSSLSLAG